MYKGGRAGSELVWPKEGPKSSSKNTRGNQKERRGE